MSSIFNVVPAPDISADYYLAFDPCLISKCSLEPQFPAVQLSGWRHSVHWGDIKGDERSWFNWPWLESARTASNLSYFFYFTSLTGCTEGWACTYSLFIKQGKRGGEERRRFGHLHQQLFRRTVRSWPYSHAARVQRLDRWCGDGDGTV